MRGKDATWVGFLAACFVVVGLAGIFATYAVPLPYERAVAHLQGAPSAPVALPAGQDGRLPARPDAEVQAVLRDAAEEAQAIALRIRLLLGILTLMAILFGTVVLRASQRQPDTAPAGRT